MIIRCIACDKGDGVKNRGGGVYLTISADSGPEMLNSRSAYFFQ